MTTPRSGGRTRQKERTRRAIVTATHDVLESGRQVTMPVVAAEARVSEATAYRHFPDLVSLLRDTVSDTWPSPAELLDPVLGEVDDPVERVGRAVRVFADRTLRYRVAVRAMVATAIASPESAAVRPVHRFGVIEHALGPLADDEQLVRDLAVVVSAEALFTLIDLCGLDAAAAVDSLVGTARTLTAAAVTRSG